MIELTPLARPYAKALFASALELNNIDEMALELKTMASASITKEVISTIENPTYSRKEVVNILTGLFDESISPTSKKLLEVLAENKRLNLLEPIYSIYQALLEKHKEQKRERNPPDATSCNCPRAWGTEPIREAADSRATR